MKAYTVTVLLPQFNNAGDTQYSEVASIVQSICKRAGGATLSEATGHWLDSEKRYEDSHTRVEVDTDSRETVEWLRSQAPIWCQLLEQECLYFRVARCELEFISSEEV